jgi:primosomal protein N'
MAAEKLGHSSATHAARYSSEEIGQEEKLYNMYHSGIGDTSYIVLQDQEFLTSRHLQETLSVRFPNHTAPVAYLSKAQQEIVEYLHGAPTTENQKHCLGLLATGEGKSETYLLPTVARAHLCHRSKMIIHVAPYGFLTG